MDYKKTNAPTNTVTRDIMDLCENTGNIYVNEECSFPATVYVSGMFNYLVTDEALTAKPSSAVPSRDSRSASMSSSPAVRHRLLPLPR